MLNFWSFFIVLIWCGGISCQLCTHQYLNTSLEFDHDYLKVDWNLALLANSTREKPKDTMPGFKIDVLRDIDQLAIELKVFYVQKKAGELYFDQKVNYCFSLKGNLYAKQVMNSFMMLGGLNIKCSHKKGDKITMKKVIVRDIILMRMYRTCNTPIMKFQFTILEDKKVAHELLKVGLVTEVVPNPSN